VSGNLTSLARVKFDAPGSGTQRFRLVYVDIDATTRGVLAIGVRDEHAIYRMAIQRITAPEESGPSGSEPWDRGPRPPRFRENLSCDPAGDRDV